MSYDIKKFIAGLGVLGALSLGGVAIAGAAGDGNNAGAVTEQSEAGEAPGTEANEAGEQSEAGEGEDKVTGPDAQKAEAAALAEVGGGKVTEVSAEAPDPAGEKAEKPEKGERPDPAYEQQIAYDVEVTKDDGSAVDVHLDKAFNVLGTEQAEQNENE